MRLTLQYFGTSAEAIGFSTTISASRHNGTTVCGQLSTITAEIKHILWFFASATTQLADITMHAAWSGLPSVSQIGPESSRPESEAYSGVISDFVQTHYISCAHPAHLHRSRKSVLSMQLFCSSIQWHPFLLTLRSIQKRLPSYPAMDRGNGPRLPRESTHICGHLYIADFGASAD
ncbi:hypothetical protein EJ06DRAFT_16962 [Trichodelitschia bisporula]|uniref:Uncharacterized protein n=1 Tax=Trichodelitschia bisporula TaxID=703511 RepID=A0A6G1IAW4_9PEZI|nr:hypothetical protein EJ06DRAFT_16962 [Trichodelitschia bisporula]